MIDILLVDDHILVRKGVREILSKSRDIGHIEEAGDGSEAMKKLSQRRYQVIVLDIALPGQSGLEILRQIKAANPNQAVLMLSMHPEEQYAIRSIKSGALGYMTKASVPDELLTAIKMISQGKRYITQLVAEHLVGEMMQPEDKEPHQTLSDREYQIFISLAKGKRNQDIAGDLCLSPKTVSTYRSRLFQKMGLHSITDLIQYAIAHKLID